MSFPTTSVLDDFNRANESPLAGNWTNGIFTGEAFNNVLTSNHVECSSGTARTTSWWNPGSFGADCEAYCALFGLDIVYLYTNLQSPGTAGVDGYEMRWRFTNLAQIFRVDNGASTQLGADISLTLADGNGFGAENVAGTITMYGNTGSWASADSRTDTTYGAGYIGMGTVDSGFGLDDFGGGTVAGPLPSDTPPQMYGWGSA